MIPLKDSVRSNTTPIINYTLIALNILVFAYELSLPPEGLEALATKYGLIPGRYPSAFSMIADPLPLLSSMFLHGGVGHLLGNLVYLYVFGDNVEDALGHGPYLIFYVFSGAGAALGQYLFDTTSLIPMIGASGAISGVLGAYLFIYPKARITSLWIIIIIPRIFVIPASIYLALYFLLQLTNGLGAIGSVVEGGVAFWAHIAGFITGAALVILKRVRAPHQYAG